MQYHILWMYILFPVVFFFFLFFSHSTYFFQCVSSILVIILMLNISKKLITKGNECCCVRSAAFSKVIKCCSRTFIKHRFEAKNFLTSISTANHPVNVHKRPDYLVSLLELHISVFVFTTTLCKKFLYKFIIRNIL